MKKAEKEQSRKTDRKTEKAEMWDTKPVRRELLPELRGRAQREGQECRFCLTVYSM